MRVWTGVGLGSSLINEGGKAVDLIAVARDLLSAVESYEDGLRWVAVEEQLQARRVGRGVVQTALNIQASGVEAQIDIPWQMWQEKLFEKGDCHPAIVLFCVVIVRVSCCRVLRGPIDVRVQRPKFIRQFQASNVSMAVRGEIIRSLTSWAMSGCREDIALANLVD